jgi:nitroreductase
MDFMECVKGRRSVRKYKPVQVEDGLLEEVVVAASYAPSWKNTQTARYIVVQDEALKKELAENCVMDFEFNKKTIYNAPALILVTTIAGRSGFERDGSYSTSKGTHWESFDAGMATQTLCLAAYAQGLATVVMGIFDEAKAMEAAGIPAGQRLSAMVAIGWPDEDPAMPKRKGVTELLDYRR